MADRRQNDRSASSSGAGDAQPFGAAPDIDFRLFIEGLSDLVCLHEPDGTYTWVSPSVRRILGYEPSEIIGNNPYDFFHPEDARRIRESTHEPALAGQSNIFVRYRLRHRDGHYVWLESLTQPHLGENGEVIRLQTSSRDISEQKAMERALRESEARYRAVIDSLTEGIVVHDSDGHIVACNPSACDMLGLKERELTGCLPCDAFRDAVDEKGRPLPADRHPAMETLQSGRPCRDVLVGVKPSTAEERIWLAINTQPFERSDDELVVASLRDITAWRQTRRKLDLFAKVFEASSEAIMISDANRSIVALNRAFTRLTGYRYEDLVGRPSATLRAGEHPPEFYEAIWKALDTQGFWRGETWNRGKDGRVFPVWLSITAVRNGEGEITHYISICADISEQYAREQHQRFLATHDSLTGLANRALAYDRIETEIRRCERDGESFAVLFVDLDNFKPVNDEYGHHVGDLLLQEAAQRLQDEVRASDTVSRLGGDEFIVVLNAVADKQDARGIACKLADRVAGPYRLGDLELSIGASIGVSIYPESGAHAEALIQAADLAMYDAKWNRDSAVAFARPAEQRTTPASRE